MEHIHGTIIENREIASGYFELIFHMKGQIPLPGQFLTLRVDQSSQPLLRRPFAFSSYTGQDNRGEQSPGSGSGSAGIVYQKRGHATTILTARRPGEQLDILSPLGNSWPMPRESRRPLLIAGGIGMGPLFFFARRLLEEGYKPILALGARNSGLIPRSSIEEFLELFRRESIGSGKAELVLATDDGSLLSKDLPQPFHGNIIQALESRFPVSGSPVSTGDSEDAGRAESGTERLKAQKGPEQLEVYSCGPHVMMHAAVKWAQMRNAPSWVSMEQTMGCAVGACMGCVVEVNDEKRYARVCSEGPIFSGGYIKW